MARKFSSLKDLYATLFFAGDARFDSYKSAQVATLWIKELDFAGCIMDCEVHFK